MEGATINLWMVIGFLIAAYAVVANDSLQTLGTYITSNDGATPKWIQMAFISAITTAVLLVGWRCPGGVLAEFWWFARDVLVLCCCGDVLMVYDSRFPVVKRVRFARQ